KGTKALRAWLDEPTGDIYELRDPGLLKLAFGSDARALARAPLPVHEERLQRFQEIHRVMEASGAPTEQRLVVESGIGHEREYVRFWKRVLAAERFVPPPAPAGRLRCASRARSGACARPCPHRPCPCRRRSRRSRDHHRRRR